MDQPSVSDLTIGDRIGDRYTLTGVLGRGGEGVVMAAWDEVLEMRCAIKILKDRHEPKHKLRFAREAELLMALGGEHVAEVFDVSELPDGRPYFVMDLLIGRDLRAELSERGRLPVDEAVGYVLEACEAMIHAHGRGIIHRDLKPANLFLVNDARGERSIKVLDLGLAKRLAPHGGSLALTESNDRMGTVAYMAPEQARALNNADARADIWSLGVVLFELLSGQRPFCGKGNPDTLFLIFTAPPKSLLLLRPEVPAPLAEVIAACLSKDPDARPPSMEALFALLAPFGPRRVDAGDTPSDTPTERDLDAVVQRDERTTTRVDEEEETAVEVHESRHPAGWSGIIPGKWMRDAGLSFAEVAGSISNMRFGEEEECA